MCFPVRSNAMQYTHEMCPNFVQNLLKSLESVGFESSSGGVSVSSLIESTDTSISFASLSESFRAVSVEVLGIGFAIEVSVVNERAVSLLSLAIEEYEIQFITY